MRSRCEVVFLWDFNTFAKLAIFKTVGAREGSPRRKDGIDETGRHVYTRSFTQVRVYRRDRGLYAGPLAAVGNCTPSSLTKGDGLLTILENWEG